MKRYYFKNLKIYKSYEAKTIPGIIKAYVKVDRDDSREDNLKLKDCFGFSDTKIEILSLTNKTMRRVVYSGTEITEREYHDNKLKHQLELELG